MVILGKTKSCQFSLENLSKGNNSESIEKFVKQVESIILYVHVLQCFRISQFFNQIF